ncbi:MAG: Smr/MutS family protein [Pseudorhodobacter sp.]
MTRRRHLKPEEEQLWGAVARSITPMHGQTLQKRLEQSNDPAPEQVKPAGSPRLPDFRIGEKARPTSTRDAETAPIRMDAKAFGKMVRGKLLPEARIDLHGMTLNEAHPELIRFVLNAQAQGLRLVLVITGKGKPGQEDGPIPQRRGILRQQVPHWLRQAPLGPAILQVTEAHLRHGGGGALYVYLRRGR